MKIKKILAMVLAVVLMLSFAACSKNGKKEKEAAELHKKLSTQENEILSKNKELWEKVFMSADKGSNMIEDGSNYGDFLLKTIESIKDKFTEDEYKLLKGEAEKIREIEVKLTELEEKYPQLAEKENMGKDGNMVMEPEGTAQAFPSFEGKDLDGNEIKSDKLFSENAVTVVNFWFTTCGPCVGELPELDALNKELSKKGGTLIGINSFTRGGDAKEISSAKEVLSKKGASYRNVYFDTGSEAGKFAEKVYAYPTTYVVDRKGNIVGDPIVGAVTGEKQMKALQGLIDKAIAEDKG